MPARRVLNPASPLAALLRSPVRPGVIEWIGVRPARRVPPVSVLSAMLHVDTGLQGDHYGGRGRRNRQITLIQKEHLGAIAAFLGLTYVAPEQLRRNVVVSGINLLGLPDPRLQIGDAVIEVTGACHPCSRMEAAFGQGGYNAVRGHGGVTARILENGTITVGGWVAALPGDL